ncbi:MAG: DUF1611 domain-containing protein [Pseudomonadota bacterium]
MASKTPTDILRTGAAKWAFTTRRVRRDDARSLSKDFSMARAGDLILCEIVEIGQHKKLQLAEGRSATSYPGDHVVVCLGDRYAPDQFHAHARITSERLDLVAGGGIAGEVSHSHARMNAPTQLRPVGLLTGEMGQILNVGDYALSERAADPVITVIGVFGASMNSGKTTAAASLAHGLARAGHSVVGIKATGTGAFGDYNAFNDAGVPVMDFTDVGMATTYKQPMDRIERGFDTLIATAASAGADIAVVEFADGVFQQETRAVLTDSPIRSRLDGILFAAPDALGAFGGAVALERVGLRPFALSGMVSCSPLATSEAGAVTGLPVLTREALCNPNIVAGHVGPLLRITDQRTAA